MRRYLSKAATILQNLDYHKWCVAFLIWYLGGLIIFHAKANFGWLEKSVENEVWWKAYYVWEQIKDAIAVIAIGSVNKTLSKIIAPIIVYSIIRVCIEVITIFVGFPDQEIWVTTLFLVALFAGVFISLRLILNRTSES